LNFSQVLDQAGKQFEFPFCGTVIFLF